MKLSLNYILVGILMTIIINAYLYYANQKVLLNENNLRFSYETYLNKEFQEAQKKYGQLTIKNAKTDLKKFSIKDCKDLNNNQFECLVETVEINTRGEFESKQKLHIISKDNQYQITYKKFISTVRKTPSFRSGI